MQDITVFYLRRIFIMNLYYPSKPYISLTAFYALSLSDYKMNLHSHPSFEIMYVTKGCCEVFIEKEKHILEGHQFIFIDANLPHRLFIEEHQFCSMLNLEFSCQEERTKINLSELVKESGSFLKLCKDSRSHLTGTDIYNLGYSLKDLISQLELTFSLDDLRIQRQKHLKKFDSDYLICLLFFRMLLELSRCLYQGQSTTGAIYLKKACDYIRKNLTEELRIPEIARYAGINKSYLQSLFSRQMHCTITDYINRKRLEQAAFLLINSSLTITDIAFHTGYNSRQHFAATFEKYYGSGPRAYRQLHGKQLETTTGKERFSEKDGIWNSKPL